MVGHSGHERGAGAQVCRVRAREELQSHGIQHPVKIQIEVLHGGGAKHVQPYPNAVRLVQRVRERFLAGVREVARRFSFHSHFGGKRRQFSVEESNTGRKKVVHGVEGVRINEDVRRPPKAVPTGAPETSCGRSLCPNLQGSGRP